MADAWGGSWGTSWGVSWGTGSSGGGTTVCGNWEDIAVNWEDAATNWEDAGACAIPAPQPSGGGGYISPYHIHREKEYQRNEAEKASELQRIKIELAEAEKRKQLAEKRAGARLVARDAAIRLAALNAKIQDEINALRMEQARLMRLRDDEEAMFILMLCRPFH